MLSTCLAAERIREEHMWALLLSNAQYSSSMIPAQQIQQLVYLPSFW